MFGWTVLRAFNGRQKSGAARFLRLYQRDALGLVDEELTAAVGFAMLARCRSILMVTEARQVDCPACQILITCPGERWTRLQPIHCPACGWQATYGQWRNSWRHQDLNGGNAVAVFRAYEAEFPRTQTARERIILIDRLIHEFHWSMRRHRTHPPAASNLIEGAPVEVLAFLDALTYGPDSTPGLSESRAEWRRRLDAVANNFAFMRERVKKLKE